MRSAVLRPADLLHRLVRAGVLTAIVVAGVVTALESARVSRDCHGAFSRAFSAAFDRYRCELVVRPGNSGREIRIPLPDFLSS
jgi:hypothetical protein